MTDEVFADTMSVLVGIVTVVPFSVGMAFLAFACSSGDMLATASVTVLSLASAYYMLGYARNSFAKRGGGNRLEDHP